MHRLHTSLAGIGVLGAVIAAGTPAAAQSGPASWSGAYIGLHASSTSAGHAKIGGAGSPLLYPGFTYTPPPPSFPYKAATHSSRDTAVGVTGGYLWGAGPFVYGIEGQVDAGRSTASFHGSTAYLANIFGGCGPTGCITTPNPSTQFVTDSIDGRLRLNWTGSLRARVGVPLGSRVLVSAFAGPSVAKASIDAVQTSQAGRVFVTPPFLIGVSPISTSASGSEDKVLWGGTVGAEGEVALAAHWRLRGEYAYTQYGKLTATIPAGGGRLTTVTARPRTDAWRFGVIYAF